MHHKDKVDSPSGTALALGNAVGKGRKANLEEKTISLCAEILEKSPMAIRLLKASLNADCDGQAGLQQLAGDATMLFYMSDEAQEGRNAFKDKRKPNFKKFPRLP